MDIWGQMSYSFGPSYANSNVLGMVFDMYNILLLVGIIGLITTLLFGLMHTMWTKDPRTREVEKQEITHKLIFGVILFAIPTVLGVVLSVGAAFARI